MSDKIFGEKDGDPLQVYPVWDDGYLKNIRIDENYLILLLVIPVDKKGELYL
jgi:hypothetical protein